MEVRIIHDNFNKTYKVGEYLSGSVSIKTKERAIDINSISITLTGTLTIKNPRTTPSTVTTSKFFTQTYPISEKTRA